MLLELVVEGPDDGYLGSLSSEKKGEGMNPLPWKRQKRNNKQNAEKPL